MLPVPAAGCSEVGYGFRAPAVDENDVAWVVWVSVQFGQSIGRVGILAAVPDDTVIIDDVVESRSECTTGLAGGWGVVVIGWISLGEADKCN